RDAPPVLASILRGAYPPCPVPSPIPAPLYEPFIAPLLRSPLCASSSIALSSSRMTLLGHRPAVSSTALCCPPLNADVLPVAAFSRPPSPFGPPPSIRLASILSAPVPCASTFAATVPHSGLRARMIGSWLGLRAVPSPSGTIGRPHRPQVGHAPRVCDCCSWATVPGCLGCCSEDRGRCDAPPRSASGSTPPSVP